jgi:ribosomal protein S21
MVKKFIKKTKKEGIIDEARERRYYTKPSDAKRLKRKKRRRN